MIDHYKKMISNKLLGQLTDKQIEQEIARFKEELFQRKKDLIVYETAFVGEEVVPKSNKYKPEIWVKKWLDF